MDIAFFQLSTHITPSKLSYICVISIWFKIEMFTTLKFSIWEIFSFCFKTNTITIIRLTNKSRTVQSTSIKFSRVETKNHWYHSIVDHLSSKIVMSRFKVAKIYLKLNKTPWFDVELNLLIITKITPTINNKLWFNQLQ